MQLEKESGAVVLEATYCILLSIIVCMFLLSFGLFLYQKAMIGIVASEVAEQVSQTYKLRTVDDNSALEVKDIEGIGKYRYFFENVRADFDYWSRIKAGNFAMVRLSKPLLAKEEGNIDVKIETVIDDIGRRHYEVTVKQKYSFLLGDLLSVVGIEDIESLEATVYVESVDVLNYINTVKFTKYGLEKVTETISIFETIDLAIKFIHSIVDD